MLMITCNSFFFERYNEKNDLIPIISIMVQYIRLKALILTPNIYLFTFTLMVSTTFYPIKIINITIKTLDLFLKKMCYC